MSPKSILRPENGVLPCSSSSYLEINSGISAPSLDELKLVSREISDPSAFISGSKIVLKHLRDELSLLHDKNQPPFSPLRPKGAFKALPLKENS